MIHPIACNYQQPACDTPAVVEVRTEDNVSCGYFCRKHAFETERGVLAEQREADRQTVIATMGYTGPMGKSCGCSDWWEAGEFLAVVERCEYHKTVGMKRRQIA